MPAPTPRPRGRPRKAPAAPLLTPEPTAQVSRFPSRAKSAVAVPPQRQVALQKEPCGVSTPPRKKLRSDGKVQAVVEEEGSSSSDSSSEEEVALLLTPGRKAGAPAAAVEASRGKIEVILREGSEDSVEEGEGEKERARKEVVAEEEPAAREASEGEDELSDEEIEMEGTQGKLSRAESVRDSSEEEEEEDAGVFSRARNGAYKAYFLPMEDENGVELWKAEERERLLELFEENGGQIVEYLKEADLVFTPPRTTGEHWTRLLERAKRHKILVLNPCWIPESVKAAERSQKDGKKRKCRVEDYQLHLLPPPKKPREPFTEEDEKLLREYWEEHKATRSTQSSLWTELEEKEPRHTAQSWLNHWRGMELKRRRAKKAAKKRKTARRGTTSEVDSQHDQIISSSESEKEVDQLASNDEELPTVDKLVAASKRKKHFDARAHDDEAHEARQAEKEKRRKRTSSKSSVKDPAPEPENRLLSRRTAFKASSPASQRTIPSTRTAFAPSSTTPT